MKPLVPALAGAFALHAAAAVSIAALGVPHGTGQKPAVLGPTIDIEAEPVAPVVRPPEPERVVAPAAVAPSRGTPRAQPVRAAPRVASVATSAPSNDTVPEPMPTQAPAAVAPVRFAMTMPAQAGAPSGTASGGAASEIAREEDVTVRARQIGGVLPSYPPDALAQGVELSAPLAFEIVVDTGGRVTSARELRHVGYGFDEAAAAALRTYRFSPAMRGGHAVPVRMRWTVDFKLD